MLSLFVPYRPNRQQILNDFIQSYCSFYPECFIYIIEQSDDDPFKRGQLANVMFNELVRKGENVENIAFVDIDLRLYDRIDFENLLAVNKTFTKIDLCEFISIGEYTTSTTKPYFLTGTQLTGGITLFTKKMFEDCNGFSNVYVGWGCEDSDFLLRNPGYKHENNTIFHLEHKREKNHKTLNRNIQLLKNRTDPSFDGYRQTTVQNTINIELLPNVFHYKFSNIGVIPNFKYKKCFESVLC